MDATTLGILCIVAMLVFMMLGVPVVYSLGFSAVCFGLIAYGSGLLPKVGNTAFYALYNLDWIPLPLFVLLGAILARTSMGEDLFRALWKWLSRIPGGLIVSGFMGQAVMSAALGTSSSTIIVVGKVAVPEFERYGYNKRFALGGLLAGGILGPLIPPSTTMIIYSVLTRVSLGQLFTAGILPGILCAVMLSIPAILYCKFKPNYGPITRSYPWKERFRSLSKVWPVILTIVAILGSIYWGIATPSESAGLGVMAVLLIGVFIFGLRWVGIKDALVETALVNGLMMFVMTGAMLFSFVVGSANLGKFIAEIVESSSLSPWMVIIAINIILLILCCPLDELTVTFITIPIFVPLIISLGFDPLWFGIVFVVNTQMGLISPPLGMDLFVTSVVFDIPQSELLRGVMPFFLTLLVFLAIIIAFPQISLWLPAMMIK